MRWYDPANPGKLLRVSSAFAASLLLVGVAGVTMPAPANADYGHVCVHSIADMPTTGWQCIQSTIGDQSRISVYYNGSSRANMRVQMQANSSRIDWMMVCDYNLDDNLRPRLAIQLYDGTTYDYHAAAGDSCTLWDRSYILWLYRGLTRTPSNALQHGSIWYDP